MRLTDVLRHIRWRYPLAHLAWQMGFTWLILVALFFHQTWWWDTMANWRNRVISFSTPQGYQLSEKEVVRWAADVKLHTAIGLSIVFQSRFPPYVTEIPVMPPADYVTDIGLRFGREDWDLSVLTLYTCASTWGARVPTQTSLDIP